MGYDPTTHTHHTPPPQLYNISLKIESLFHRSGIIFCRKLLEEQINNAVFPSLQGGPHNHQIAALSVALSEASQPDFHEYIAQVKKNAKGLAASLISKGYVIVTNGTDNHIVLWDLRPSDISGSKIEKILEKCDISVNKNSVRGDISAVTPGGVRLGTPAMTTRGMKEEHMYFIGDLLHEAVELALRVQRKSSSKKLADFLAILNSTEFEIEIKQIKNKVETLALNFPMPGLVP